MEPLSRFTVDLDCNPEPIKDSSTLKKKGPVLYYVNVQDPLDVFPTITGLNPAKESEKSTNKSKSRFCDATKGPL